MNDNDVETLAIALANAKNVEAEAKIARVKAEEALASAIGDEKSATKTVRVGRFGITVKRGFNYTIDRPEEFAEKFPSFIRWTEKFDIISRKYEEERERNSTVFLEMSEYVTAKPKKVSVELKL